MTLNYHIPSFPHGNEIKSIFGALLIGIPSLTQVTSGVGKAESRVSKFMFSPTQIALSVRFSKNLGARAIAKRKYRVLSELLVLT